MQKYLFSRRKFFQASALISGSVALARARVAGMVGRKSSRQPAGDAPPLLATDLPKGNAPAPLNFSHFPSRLHACMWRNWQLVPLSRLARVLHANPQDLLRTGRRMGLWHPPRIPLDQQRRSYITVIKANWHLLPYGQLLELLDWTPDHLAFTLREDDFLYVKLGSLKPQCEPLYYAAADKYVRAQEAKIRRVVRQEFRGGLGKPSDPLFSFVSDLSSKPGETRQATARNNSSFSPRFCYSYFTLYGDPLLETESDPYPEGYLARMAAAGVDGVWLQAVLSKLFPFPWDIRLSAGYEERLRNLRALAARARKHRIGVYLYLNEPRAMPLDFFTTRPHLKGVVEGDYAALCTSDPGVQNYLVRAVASICRAVPDLAGFFTITASENLSNCWSHHKGANCPRCGQLSPAQVIGELNGLIHEGIRQSDSAAQLIAWDWGWDDDWAEDIIHRLPPGTALMSVSEWALPIERGGVRNRIGEYSISTIGPGPRARRHWEMARKRGLKTVAKIQAGNTWELSAVPYIPAVGNVAQHAANLRQANVQGLMLGWTLGGYPSPNLEVVAEIGQNPEITPLQAMKAVALRRFGPILADTVVKTWNEFSLAFSEFPFGEGLYFNPLQVGPANLLWGKVTGYSATMVGFPYDDLARWRAAYPPEIFIAQLEKIADGFDRAILGLKAAGKDSKLSRPERSAVQKELNVGEAAAIHFRSAANQARFVQARELADRKKTGEGEALRKVLEETIINEMGLARRLYDIQMRDSRIGFEASNQYYYLPLDLAEKILNCRDLLDRWLPGTCSQNENCWIGGKATCHSGVPAQ